LGGFFCGGVVEKKNATTTTKLAFFYGGVVEKKKATTTTVITFFFSTTPP
jgi:hypothetical protein